MYGIQLAFKNFEPAKGIFGGDFVGLKYFSRFVNSFQFIDLIRNTVLISIYTLGIGFPIPIILALTFNQIKNGRAKRFMQTISYMPHFISVIVMVGMLLVFLSPSSGFINKIMELLGMNTVNFMGESSYFRSIYAISDVWQHAGWNSIIYLAALSSIDVQLYDAAKVDGASKWKQILYIDMPCLTPTIIILLILNSGSIMNVGFEKVFLMQNSMNLSVSEVISTYVYKIGIMSNQISYSSAIGLFNTLINFAFLVIVNVIAKKTSEISLW
jgi:putative aldouronate transport system permease protein